MARKAGSLRRQTPPKNDMTIPKEILELAVAGGWKDFRPTIMPHEVEDEPSAKFLQEIMWHEMYREKIALDPLFWQALGKERGWEHEDTIKPINEARWIRYAMRFLHLILSHSDTAAFWQEILTNPK